MKKNEKNGSRDASKQHQHPLVGTASPAAGAGAACREPARIRQGRFGQGKAVPSAPGVKIKLISIKLQSQPFTG